MTIANRTARKAHALLLDVVELADEGIDLVAKKFGYPSTAVEFAKAAWRIAPSYRDIPSFGGTKFSADPDAAYAIYFRACSEAAELIAGGWTP